MIFQSAQVWGNLISSEVLKQSEQSLKSNFTNQSLGYDVIKVCGANDCGQGITYIFEQKELWIILLDKFVA